MKDIKYRIWCEKQKEFHYWGFIDESFTSPITNKLSIEYCKENSEQYTGLKDKHGVEIYEGDKAKYKNDNYGQIVFETGAFIFACDTVVDSYKHLYDLIFDDEIYNFSCNLEVTGNIHEIEVK